MRYSSLLRTCYFSEKDVFVAGVWGGVLLYDIFVFALLVLNALNRPRRHDHEIISNLQRDGTAIFIMQFLLRMTNFVQSIASGAAQTFVAILIVWSLDTAISFRLFLKSNYVELAMGDRSRFDVISPSAEAVLITEEIELANM
ncbi:uncharacterized protein LAESUDRAFT_816863 [Laetiporus sulphureus 93-53]|uniref:Uncharacterized protein n=1 Tax=Laetiporus sulphureus 93-53 TaxID=1314785 RepID=A0A165AVE0_9APHY|nr:uncharacterized protein LAESUDRAFT_816863 [Laetiporus sulphureus 93-53]KZS99737.1 hypothetical protein LAESUDRAFT_816863 [Laetiporus sulphureus 93-53]